MCLLISISVSAQAKLVINEVMSSNRSTIRDPRGDYSDWIELYNTGPSKVFLGDKAIGDSNHIWPFPSIYLPAGQYLILWANDQNRQSTFELNFKISAGGEVIRIGTQNTLLDEVDVPQMASDESFGRYQNGIGEFERMNNPTPNTANIRNTIPNNPDAQYIKINEAVTSNVTGIVDEDGESKDWIELFNTGIVSVNMSGLRLADSSKQWIFPSVDISPGGYLLVFASNKNRTDPAGELHTNFALTSAGEELHLYNIDGSTVVDSVNILPIAPDHSYCRIPNGTGGFKESTIPTPLAENQHSNQEPNPDAGLITINEIVSNNQSGLRDYENDFEDWIEFYNKGTKAVNLQGLKLADSEKVWSFPSRVLEPGEYLVVFASGKNEIGTELHTNFKISSTTGETISFLNRNDSFIESPVTVSPMGPDVSYGRDPDGSGGFREYPVPTPRAENRNVSITPNPDAQYISINEVSSNNSSGLQDTYGQYPDWIELYNTHNTAINLEGLKLQDYSLDPNQPETTTWVFPDVSIEPGQYLVVFASGNNIIDPSEMHTNFKLKSSGEGLRFINKDGTVVSSIEIDPLDENVSFGRDPDGTGDFKVFSIPTPGDTNETLIIDPNPDADLITINEVVADNRTGLKDEDGEYQDWIELYNKGSKTVDLQDLKLQDSGDVWSFPSRTLGPGQYLVVFASGKNRSGSELHTNFHVDLDGETLQLLNKDSSIVETFILPEQDPDQSYGRNPDGAADLKIFTTPTPWAANGLLGDLTNDGLVNYYDFLRLLSQWGNSELPPEDLNRSGNVDYYDFLLLLGNWSE